MLPTTALESYRELVSVGEFQVALENLCTNLDDYGVVLGPDVRQALVVACKRFELSPRYWEKLDKPVP